ncbi:hypothetical protein [Marinilactibacillus kalidii]|uniref:hypothetical protein n=1 Tax=Marinilactibacillus kalidii TaxID=2820274 RepID=UPI001ABDD55F|nr:hypothetical protein [Marinilactibacillus kalidii]
MFNYIKADLYRLMHKKSNYIYYGVLFAAFVLFTIFTMTNFSEGSGYSDGFLQAGIILLSQAFPLLFGIQAYSVVYLNDVSSSSYQNIFSSGLSKVEFVIGKLIVFITYMFTTFLAGAIVYLALYLFVMSSENADFNIEAFKTLATVGGSVFLGMIGYAGLANLVAYVTQNTTMSLITFGVLISNISLTALDLISLVTDKLEFLRKWTMSYYLSDSNNTLLFGSVNEVGMPFKTWGIIGIYILVTAIAGIVLLRKIEIKEGK